MTNPLISLKEPELTKKINEIHYRDCDKNSVIFSPLPRGAFEDDDPIIKDPGMDEAEIAFEIMQARLFAESLPGSSKQEPIDDDPLLGQFSIAPESESPSPFEAEEIE